MQVFIDCKDHLKSVITSYNFCLSKGMDLQALQKLSFSSDLEKTYSNLLLTYMHKLEAISPGSFELFLSMLNGTSLKDVPVEVLQKNNIKQLLHSYANESTKNLVYEALNLAGLSGKVVLLKQSIHLDHDVIELNKGSYFDDLITSFQIKNSKYLDAKIICIDGYIETVSELNRLLESASSSKEIIFLFVRGLSDDVVHTLKVNYDRGTLTVIPVITKYDLDGVNLLNDIAIVAGCDVISSLKGQLISTVDLNSSVRVDVITIGEHGVLIENKKTHKNVDQHIYFLQKKLMEHENSVAKDFLTKRIKGLGSNRVTISLKLDQQTLKKSFMIDRCLRATKIAATHGIVNIEDKVYPAASYMAAKHYQEKFNDMISNLGSVIIQ